MTRRGSLRRATSCSCQSTRRRAACCRPTRPMASPKASFRARNPERTLSTGSRNRKDTKATKVDEDTPIVSCSSWLRDIEQSSPRPRESPQRTRRFRNAEDKRRSEKDESVRAKDDNGGHHRMQRGNGDFGGPR